MARIDVLPSIDIIKGLKGTLDFYLWRGLPCVRAWPQYRPARQTDASLAAALTFGAIIKAYSLLAPTALEAYRQMALAIPRTARDVYVSGVFGNLHEASMSDFLTLLTECRNFLSALTAILNALDSINTDEIVVNVDQSVLPPLAATSTGQATMITALQKIDDLQDALQSQDLDRLLVRGENQLHSFHSVLAQEWTAIISGAGGNINTGTVPAGFIWHVTSVAARDITSPTTAINLRAMHDAQVPAFAHTVQAFAANQWHCIPAEFWLDVDDYVRGTFTGGLVGDTCGVSLFGEVFTKET